MESELEIIAAVPDAFSDSDRRRFRDLVVAADEVDEVVLAKNIEAARVLVVVREGSSIRGVAALKRPQASYRLKTSKRTGIDLPEEEYPFELGYVHLEADLRGRKLSHRLVAAALDHCDDRGLFATVRTDNAKMRATLAGAGFTAVGEPYAGRKEGEEIGLLVKPPR